MESLKNSKSGTSAMDFSKYINVFQRGEDESIKLEFPHYFPVKNYFRKCAKLNLDPD